VLRTDNGREFTVAEFTAYCAEGIERYYSAPYSPQQNDVVERRNQTVVAMARALLKQRRLLARFWGEAVVTAVHLLNRAPTKALSGMTPYEAWHNKAPAVAHLRQGPHPAQKARRPQPSRRLHRLRRQRQGVSRP
jgi:IS30 family transposase